MHSISFNQVTPQVFAKVTDLHSEVWKSQVTFERGKKYLVAADSGCGKSTFCSYLQGYRNDYTGQILFDKTDIKSYAIRQWVEVRQRHIAMLFQEMRLFAELTAYENVMIKNRLTSSASAVEVKDWFSRLGLSDKLDVKAGQLSQGQQQRVALLRSLVQPFDFLVADEPISHLDDTNSYEMAHIIREIIDKNGAGLIVTSIGRDLPFDYDKTLKL